MEGFEKNQGTMVMDYFMEQVLILLGTWRSCTKVGPSGGYTPVLCPVYDSGRQGEEDFFFSSTARWPRGPLAFSWKHFFLFGGRREEEMTLRIDVPFGPKKRRDYL